MKKLNLVNLYKSEIKKNLLAQIKGGIDIKCTCSINSPTVSTRQAGGPATDLCACGTTSISAVSIQDKPGIF
jgi:hypothetical protein